MSNHHIVCGAIAVAHNDGNLGHGAAGHCSHQLGMTSDGRTIFHSYSHIAQTLLRKNLDFNTVELYFTLETYSSTIVLLVFSIHHKSNIHPFTLKQM